MCGSLLLTNGAGAESKSENIQLVRCCPVRIGECAGASENCNRRDKTFFRIFVTQLQPQRRIFIAFGPLFKQRILPVVNDKSMNRSRWCNEGNFRVIKTAQYCRIEKWENKAAMIKANKTSELSLKWFMRRAIAGKKGQETTETKRNAEIYDLAASSDIFAVFAAPSRTWLRTSIHPKGAKSASEWKLMYSMLVQFQIIIDTFFSLSLILARCCLHSLDFDFLFFF